MQAVENCPTQPSAQRRSTAAVLRAAAARSAAGWAAPNRDTSKTIDVHLGWLRRKLGDDAPTAQTAAGNPATPSACHQGMDVAPGATC